MVSSPRLSDTDTLLAVVGAGVVVHLIYKRFESYEPTIAGALLLGVPLALSSLYLPHAANFISAASTVFPVFWATILSSIVLYRLSPWHPLAKYPGPLLCRVSKFYVAIRSLGGKQFLYYDKLHAKYGPVVRIGPNELSFCDVSAVQPLLGNTGLPKGPFWDGRVPEQEVVKPLIAIRDKTEHTRRRRPWTRAFSTNALKGYEIQITKRANQLVDALATQKSPANLSLWISYFAYDIMSDLAFGGGSEMMAQGDTNGLWSLLEAGQKNAIFMSHVPWLGRLALRYPSFAGSLKAFRAHARSRAVLRKKEGSPHKDIFHHLMDEDGVASQPPTAVEVTSDGGLVIIAGSDTTSSAMSHLFYFLMCNPVAYKRLQAEVDELGDDVLDTTKHAHMGYLNGAINETLRLLPPIMSGSQRTPDKDSGGRMIGTHFLPEGNSAFIPTYSLHRDPRYFSPAPDSFLPERWLSEEKRVELEPKVFSNPSEYVHNQAAFIPFSLGPTNCAGKNLAYLEMRMVICLIMSRLDLKLIEGYDHQRWHDDMNDFFVTTKGELPTIITPRKGRSKY